MLLLVRAPLALGGLGAAQGGGRCISAAESSTGRRSRGPCLCVAISLLQEYTFTLTGGDGKRYHGFCRKFLPPKPAVGHRAQLPQVLCLVSEDPWATFYFKARAKDAAPRRHCLPAGRSVTRPRAKTPPPPCVRTGVLHAGASGAGADGQAGRRQRRQRRRGRRGQPAAVRAQAPAQLVVRRRLPAGPGQAARAQPQAQRDCQVRGRRHSPAPPPPLSRQRQRQRQPCRQCARAASRPACQERRQGRQRGRRLCDVRMRRVPLPKAMDMTGLSPHRLLGAPLNL